MIPQIVRRVVGCAGHFYVVAAHQATGRELGLLELLVAFVVDLAGCRSIQELRYAEGRAEFEVCPVVQRVAHAVGHRFGPLLELLPVACVACDIFLLDPVAPERTPLVVVASKPEFRDALEAMVLGHLLRIEVTMVVDDGQMGCVVMIKVLRRRRLQQEVLVHEVHNYNKRYIIYLYQQRIKRIRRIGCSTTNCTYRTDNQYTNRCLLPRIARIIKIRQIRSIRCFLSYF